MKKYFLYSTLVAIALAGCDYNEDNFEGFDELGKPTDVKNLEYTLTADDYASISSNSANKALAGTEGVSKELGYVKNDKCLSDAIPAAKYLPAFIAAKWYTADKGSSVKVTYDKSVEAPAYVSVLASSENYEVTPGNYASVWGEVDAPYFTPAKPLSKYVNKMLTTAFPDAVAGDVKVVNYKYSLIEPGGGTTAVATELDEAFDNATEANKNTKTEVDGWKNIAEKGDKYWVNNYYNGGYTQCSAYGATEDVVTWLVSPKVDLSKSENPRFAFDICLGYPNGAQLQVLVSDDFNGTDVNAATWTDLTTYFAFDASNAKYGKMSPAGCYDMSAYKGSPVYVAFKYMGNASQTTTFQLDNVQLGDKADVTITDVYVDDFEAGSEAWTAQVVQGTFEWAHKTFNNNSYMQFSANKSTEEQESYLVSPAVEVPAAANGVTAALMFDICIGYWNADCLSVLVSTDYTDDATKATWDDVTAELAIPQAPSSGYGTSSLCGLASLKKYAGKTVHVAYRYVGNGAEKRTTTVQIDNVRVVTLAHAAGRSALAARVLTPASYQAAVYEYNGTSWALYDGAIAVGGSDYEEMGFSTFSSDNLPANYLPQFLAKNYPYAQEGKAVGVIYTFNSEQEAAEYVFTDGAWVKNSNVETFVDQFVFNGSQWNFDPSTTISLPPTKSDATTVMYMQAVTDWVWENIDQKKLGVTEKGKGYVTSYGNNEYYTGCSAYYGNVDMRVAKAREQYAAGYEGMDDAAVFKAMCEHLIEAMGPVLEQLNPNAVPVDGVDVLYTVQVGIYEGTNVSTVTHQLVYKVVGKGKFEYVPDSFQPVVK